jgi:Carboxypeptidase regulatory-like domain
MSRKLGCMMILLVLALPAAAAGKPGAITGYVRNSAGVPQMGAAVEVVSSVTRAMTVFTDARGFFDAAGLEPGTYHVKVTAPSFLPSLRENVSLRAGASILVNITLNTLFEAVQLLPQRRGAQEDDGWKWTLRSSANRPILRVVDNGPVVVSRTGSSERVLKARVAFVAGGDAEGFGSSSEMSTRFTFEKSLFSAGLLSLNGNVGYGTGPQGVLRAAYSHRMSDGSNPELSLTARRFGTPDTVLHNGALQALTLRLADSATFADFVDLHFGTEYQTIQFMGRVSALKPFGSADVHLSPNTVLEYRYATSEPNTRAAKGFDSAPADLSESGPRVSMVDSNAVLERARHQEISLSRRFGNSSLQVAGYSDRIRNAALTGAGEVFGSPEDFLPDVYSGTFTYNGGQLNTRGLRLVFEQKLPSDLTATVSYTYGGVLDLAGEPDWSSLRSSIHREYRHAVGAKLAGKAPVTHTRWLASYRWMDQKSLLPVDLFDVSPGQMDPYFNVFLRQPLPSTSFFPAKMEALVDLRNLLAQGYMPVIGKDGRTLYLVQSARSVRGGVAFVF